MITEQQLKADCTPELIKKMVELAEGFEWLEDEDIESESVYIFIHKGQSLYYYGLDIVSDELFPLLIYRAFEGASKKYIYKFIIGIDHEEEECYIITKELILSSNFLFKNYRPTSLTHAECAMLHCLQEVLK